MPMFGRRDGAHNNDRIALIAHSNVLYWWPVWLYAGFCWIVTGLSPKLINPTGLKEVKVFTEPWLGLSFLGVVFFVLLFSNIRLHNLQAGLGLSAIAVLLFVADRVGWLPHILGGARLLEVYMTQAFYGVTAVGMLMLWLIVVFLTDRLTKWKLRPGQLTKRDRLGGNDRQGEAIPTPQMRVRVRSNDPFRHFILGGRWLGFGTGDLVLIPHTAGAETIVLENIVRLEQRMEDIQRLLGNGPGAPPQGGTG